MNILIFSWRGPGHPNSGGAEIATHEHAKAWVQAGHSVFLFTSAFPGVPSEEVVDGVQIIRRGNQIGTIQIVAVFWYLFQAHVKFDLVVDQFHGIPFFTPLFVRSRKLAFIHEVAREIWWTNHLKFPIKYIYGAIGYFLEPLIFLLYKNVNFMTVSKSTKSDLIDWRIPESQITIINNGVTVQPVSVKKELTPTIIYLGALAEDKGIEDALEVFNRLPNWQFWVVGRGESSYLSKLNFGAGVKVWGFVEEKEKFELLSRAHIMINTSHREGWGLVNIEANSVGTPVVAYDVPGCRDSIHDGKTGLLCKRGDLDCLAKSIVDLYNNPENYQTISKNAKIWSDSFSWEKSTQESLKLITRLLTK